jgi:RHS repeat-associated protein
VDPLGFEGTGRALDAAAELAYYRARYYHAQLGRFVGRDPVGYFQPDGANKDQNGIRVNTLAHGNDSESTDTLEGDANAKSIAKINDFNLYCYAHNRPLDLLDPTGLFPCHGIKVRAKRVFGIWVCPKVDGEKAWGPYPASAQYADGTVASWKECLYPCDKMDCPECQECIAVQRTLPPNELGTIYSFPTCVCK